MLQGRTRLVRSVKYRYLHIFATAWNSPCLLYNDAFESQSHLAILTLFETLAFNPIRIAPLASAKDNENESNLCQTKSQRQNSIVGLSVHQKCLYNKPCPL